MITEYTYNDQPHNLKSMEYLKEFNTPFSIYFEYQKDAHLTS